MPLNRPVLGAVALQRVVRESYRGKASVYQVRNHARSETVCRSLRMGLEEAGYEAKICYEDQYTAPVAQIAAFYGFVGNLPKIMREHEKAIFVDFGYWGRRVDGRYTGYNKIAVNDRHPTAYFRTKKPDFSRLSNQDVAIHPYRRRGQNILLIGMSHKAAKTCGYRPGEWERKTAIEIRKYTNRPIIYRPKPSDKFAVPIPDTEFLSGSLPFQDALDNVHAVVARHSNAAVEALLYGVPVFVEDGVALSMAQTDLSLIESPYYPEDREGWAADIAWTQWTLEEMQTAEPWDHLKTRGII